MKYQLPSPRVPRILRHCWPHFAPQRSIAIGSFLVLLAEVLLRLLEPWPLKLLFDWVFVPGAARRSAPPAWLAELDQATIILLCAFAVVTVVGLRALAGYASTIGFARLGQRVLRGVRLELFQHLQRLPLSFHARTRGGDLMSTISNDVSLLQDVTVTAILPLSANLLILVGMLVFMFWLNAELALIAVVIVPLSCLVTLRLGRRMRSAARAQRKREGQLLSDASEALGAIRIVQSLSLEREFLDRFSSQSVAGGRDDVRAKRLAAGLERTVDLLIAVATAVVLWHGAQLVLRQALTPGDLLVFLTYLKNGFRPIRDFAKYTGRLAKASAAGDRVVSILDEPPAIRDRPSARVAPRLDGNIELRHLSLAYEPDRPVLRGIDLTIPGCRHTAIVGLSGSGKSTILSLILRLYDPDEGCVRINGGDIRDYTLESLRAQISAVPQDNLLFAGTIAQNIALSRPDATHDQIMRAATLAHARDFIDQLPDGLGTQVGERGVTLSSGQRQRIAIARAALRDAPIMLFDEPSTGLDEENARAIIGAIRELSQGRTVVTVTHDLRLAESADVIVHLASGQVIEQGPHAELLRRSGRYALLYRLQTGNRSLTTQEVAGHAHVR